MISLIQVDCEVLDTKLIHVEHGLIPQHLRAYANFTTNKAPSKNESFSQFDVPKYYKKLYKPYFMNKNGVKHDRDFLNINLN